jgi:hypothetical protein
VGLKLYKRPSLCLICSQLNKIVFIKHNLFYLKNTSFQFPHEDISEIKHTRLLCNYQEIFGQTECLVASGRLGMQRFVTLHTVCIKYANVYYISFRVILCLKFQP